jgi:hypothetical protein
MTTPVMALIQALGLLWLIVGLGYFLMWQDNQMLKKVQKGISTIVIMSLPVTLFESLYTINLQSVNFKLIITIFLVRTRIFERFRCFLFRAHLYLQL